MDHVYVELSAQELTRLFATLGAGHLDPGPWEELTMAEATRICRENPGRPGAPPGVRLQIISPAVAAGRRRGA